MMMIPDHIKELFNEWADAQRQAGPYQEVEMPQELKDYFEDKKRVLDEAEANGCMIG